VSVVLDVHAICFRTRAQVDALDFAVSNVEREVKLVLESDPSEQGLHLFHTRGLCKFARPELMCFIHPDDSALMGRVFNQLSCTLMEGATAKQLHLRVAPGVELTTTPTANPDLVASLGLETAVVVGRKDGAALAGISRVVPVA
jgi:hypothetical protein